MCMVKLQKIWIFLMFLMFSFFPVISLNVPSSQQNIELAIIKDKTFSYLLIFQNEEDVTREINITCSGDCEVIKFGGEMKDSYRLFLAPHSQVYLPIYLKGGEIGEFNLAILANNEILSRMKIYVTISPENARELIQQKPIFEELKEIVNEGNKNLVQSFQENFGELNSSVKNIEKTLEEISRKIESKEVPSKKREDMKPVYTEKRKTHLPILLILVVIMIGILLSVIGGTELINKLQNKFEKKKFKYSYKPNKK